MRFRSALGVLVLALVIAGCRTAPITNVDDAVIPTVAGKTLTQEQVRSAIIRGGGALGWQMKDEGPDKLVATLLIRTHTAVVDIPYSTTSYSIKYRSSINLDESGGKIHSNYNGWIQNLQKSINTQLSVP